MRIVFLTAVSISTVSCLPFGSGPSDGRPVMDVYQDASAGAGTLRILKDGSPLARPMPVPVIAPPEVFPVYVPTHVDPERDMMVGEHYLFIKLRDAVWLAEALHGDDPIPDSVAPDEEVKRLRERIAPPVWGKALVPHREGTNR